MSRMELTWRLSFSASCLHAAQAVCQGKTIVDPRLASVLTEPAQNLADEIRIAGLPESRLWRNLLALSWQFDNNRELAALALRKSAAGGKPDESLVSRLSGRIAAIESAVQQAVPGLVDELQLRERPLREQWEAYGPGLLHGVALRTDPQLLAERADVVLVLPVRGGHGAAHLANNSVSMEAVLANPLPQLPEIVRLGWLLSQLQMDLPRFSERFHPDRLPLVAGLAMLPAVLESAADLEICRPDSATAPFAIEAWQIASPDLAETVSLWWETHLAAPSHWSTALTALDRMLP